MPTEETEPNALSEEELDLEEMAESFPKTEPITFYGTDFDVHGLVRRLNQGDIVVPNFNPGGDADHDMVGFQRAFVWRRYQMDRFVESLLLGYPVPGIFLVQQGDNKLLVLDGQQRLRTLQRFYSGALEDGSEFALESVGDDFVALTYESLDTELRRALDNSFIHATVIRYDPDQGGDESVYQLFERLNASGSNLYPHEIRVALYPGKLVETIAALNTNEDWRTIYGPKNPRLKDQEQILRFLALYTENATYKRPLKGFLNSFLKRHRQLEDLDMPMLRRLFEEVCSVLAGSVGRQAFRTSGGVNAAMADAVMIGMARRVRGGGAPDPKKIERALQELKEDETFLASVARATADEDRVAARLQKATDAFARA